MEQKILRSDSNKGTLPRTRPRLVGFPVQSHRRTDNSLEVATNCVTRAPEPRCRMSRSWRLVVAMPAKKSNESRGRCRRGVPSRIRLGFPSSVWPQSDPAAEQASTASTSSAAPPPGSRQTPT
ncbi:unnamed protein product [Ixodes persulcatus]